ncbi:MAG: isoprenyl transferase [Salinarimonas sp.]|nr:isoprenyl transferase [Salinarimonas sp.]
MPGDHSASTAGHEGGWQESKDGGGCPQARLPRHVAVIMDGNGRWASRRGLPRVEGHRQGVEAVRRCVRAAAEAGIGYLTLYAFSAENWRRPSTEVSVLMSLLKRYVRSDLEKLHEAGIRIRIIGDRDGLSADILGLLQECETRTRDNNGMTLVVAFNYGGRQEIARAARRLAERVAAGTLEPGAIDEACFAAALDTAGMPDPDLVIRTSGEQRVSNFLPWQSAYAEYVFLPDLWPDFNEAVLARALAEYARRERRFGGLGSGVPEGSSVVDTPRYREAGG